MGVKKGMIKVGPIEFAWEKDLKNPNNNIKDVERSIDSIISLIDIGVDPSTIHQQLIKFINIIMEFGWIVKLSGEYQSKVKKIGEFEKEQCRRRTWIG